jgi:adenylosuccinate lyase
MIPRYSTPEMDEIWSDEFKLGRWIDIESVVAYAMEGHKLIPTGLAEKIYAHDGKRYDIKALLLECKEEEKITQHDVVAFIQVLERRVGPLGRFIHYGLTSSDLVDTCFAMQMVKSLITILDGTAELCRATHALATEHKHTAMIGRTHGQYAEPTTFGLVMLSHHNEFVRHVRNLDHVCKHIAIGKLSGAQNEKLTAMLMALKERK